MSLATVTPTHACACPAKTMRIASVLIAGVMPCVASACAQITRLRDIVGGVTQALDDCCWRARGRRKAVP